MRQSTMNVNTVLELPQDGLVDYVRGLDLLVLQKWEQSISAFSQAIQSDNEAALFYLARGVAHIATCDPSKAAIDLERANRLTPNHATTRSWLAVSVSMQGDFSRASTIFPFATQDLEQSFVRQAAHEYGEVAFRSPRGEVTTEMLQVQNQAKIKIADAVSRYADDALSQPGLESLVIQMAQQSFEQGDYVAAFTRLNRFLLQDEQIDAQDPSTVLLYARCMIELGRLAPARQLLTRLLTRDTNFADGYVWRGLAAAKMGDMRRAEQDRSVASKILSNPSHPQLQTLSNAIASAQPTPSKPNFSSLEKIVQSDLHTPALQAAAKEILRSFEPHRLRYDERYQDRLRELEFAVRKEPNNVASLVELGQFLLDEIAVRQEQVQPGTPHRPIRYQTAAMASADLQRSEQLANQALALDSTDVSALCLKAACQYWNRDFRSAARNISKAFELNPKSVPVLRVLSLVLEMEAVEKSAEAAALRRPTYAGSYEQRFGDYIHTYTRWIRPSNADLQQAALLAEQSKKLREEALERLFQASSIVQEPGQKHQLLGLYFWYRGDLEKASSEYEAAVALEPTQSQWHFNLAAIYDAQGRTTDAFEQRVISINSMDTSVAPLLAATWELFAKTKLRSVRQTLVRCADIDPSDPRTAAYLGITELHAGNSREAISWLELAIALESARLNQHGIEVSALPDTSASFSVQKLDYANTCRLSPGDLGFTLGASLRLVQAYRQTGKHDRSALLAQQLLRHEHRVLFTDRATDVIEAILPDPSEDLDKPPRREHTSSLFAWLRVAGGEALYHQEKVQQAIEFLQPTQRVEGKLQNGRGEERLIGPMLYGAIVLARSYLALGDLENATQYVNLVPQKRFGVGPSKSPYAALEEEGSQLREQIRNNRSR